MHRDILGQELHVDDRVAYARQGRGTDHGTLVIGKIVALKDTGTTTNRYDFVSKTYSEEPNLTATIEWENIGGYGYPRYGSHGPRISTVTKFDNMIRIGFANLYEDKERT